MNKDKDTIIKVALFVASILILIFILSILSKKDDIVRVKNPYGKIDDTVAGDISIEEYDDDFEPEEDLRKVQAIDANRITYVRKNIPTLGISMLIPEKWEVIDEGSTIRFIANKDVRKDYDYITKFQITMYAKDSGESRSPGKIRSFFDDYVGKYFRYKYAGSSLKPELVISRKDTKVMYNKDKKVYLRKNLMDKYIQEVEIPDAEDKSEYVEVDYFLGEIESFDYEMKDDISGVVKMKPFVKHSKFLAGGNKSVILSFAAPKNYEMEIDEMARVMAGGIQPYDPGESTFLDYKNKTLNKDINLTYNKFKSSERFKELNKTHTSYMAKLYDDIYDPAYGINLTVNEIAKGGYHFRNLDPINSNLIQTLIFGNYYSDVADFEPTFSKYKIKMASSIPITQNGYKGFTHTFKMDIEGDKIDPFKSKIAFPSNFMVNIIDTGDVFVVTSISFNDNNASIAKKYNDSLLSSIKNKK